MPNRQKPSKEPGSPLSKVELGSVIVVTESSRAGVSYKTVSHVRQFPESLILAMPVTVGNDEEPADPKRSR